MSESVDKKALVAAVHKAFTDFYTATYQYYPEYDLRDDAPDAQDYIDARADLAADLPTKGNEVADLLSQAGDLVARAARDRGDSVEPSTDVPDYDDDSANDEPTDSSSEDEDDDSDPSR